MPVVSITERLLAPAAAVWQQVCDIESYPTFMESVIATRVLSREARPDGVVEAVAEWEGLLKGSVLKWTEREWRDEAAMRLTYEQVDGDLQRFQGYWQVKEIDDRLT